MMTETEPEEIDVEQFANETVRLTAAITRVLNAPDILTGEVSGSGKTIAVEHPNREGKTYRLDTATIMAGDSEFRDSWSFELYTREDFQNTQSANYGPGAQAGANGISDAEDLPEPTHTPVGQDTEDEDDSDDDPDADGSGEDQTEDGRDEFGRVREGERVHMSGVTEDGERLDARGTVQNVSGAGTTVELDDGRLVRKKASVIKGRSPEGATLYFRKPEMEHITEDAEPGSEGENPGDNTGKTVMTDGGEPEISEGDEVKVWYTLETGPSEGKRHGVGGTVHSVTDGEITIRWGFHSKSEIVVDGDEVYYPEGGLLGTDAKIRRVETDGGVDVMDALTALEPEDEPTITVVREGEELQLDGYVTDAYHEEPDGLVSGSLSVEMELGNETVERLQEFEGEWLRNATHSLTIYVKEPRPGRWDDPSVSIWDPETDGAMVISDDYTDLGELRSVELPEGGT